MNQYKSSKSVSPEQGTHLRKLAYDYQSLVKAISERGRLYELDGGAESKLTPKEMSRRAAAKTGLAMPDLSDREHFG